MTPEVVELLTLLQTYDPPPIPDTSLLVTEDDAPMDNIYVEKLQRLYETEPLYSSWSKVEKRSFLALSNVGLFFDYTKPPVVPDVMLSLDVPLVDDRREPDNRSYFSWVMGKMPDAVIEIVSDRRGGEDTDKMRIYKRLRITYYVIYDPGQCLKAGVLRAFAFREKYESIDPAQLQEIGLGLKLWRGIYEGQTETWLRWCDAAGQLIPTGQERADQAEQHAAELEEKNRLLRERLRQLGEKVD